MGVAIMRSITRPLDQAVALADGIAAGDLTGSVQSNRGDELGHLLGALNGMAQRLRGVRSEEHTSELQSPCNLVCRLLLEKKRTTCPPILSFRRAPKTRRAAASRLSKAAKRVFTGKSAVR